MSTAELAHRLVDAFQTHLSPSVAQHQRHAAFTFIEDFKRNFVECIPVAMHIVANAGGADAEMENIRHFGFHCLENSVVKGWNTLGEEQKVYVKRQALNFLSTAPPTVPSKAVRARIVKIVAEIGKREWPQQWKEMTSDLFKIANLGAYQTAMVVLVLGELADEVIGFDPRLPEKRRRELKQGLIAAMATIFPFLQSVLSSQIDAKASGNVALIESVLQAYLAMLTFIPDTYVFDQGLLTCTVQLLSAPPLCSLVCDILSEIADKRPASLDRKYYPSLVTLWGVVNDFADTLLAAPPFPEQQPLLQKVITIMTRLTRFHSALLKPVELEGARTKYLGVLGKLLATPSRGLSLAALDLWVVLFKNAAEDLIQPAYRAPLIMELFKVCVVRLTKSAKPEAKGDEFDSEDEYLAHFAKFRSTTLRLIELVVEFEPLICLQLTLNRYRSVLSQRPDNGLNAAGYASTEASQYREFEASGTLLDCIFHRVPLERFAPSAENNELINTATNLLGLLVTYQTNDPLMLTRRLHDICLFISLFQHHKPLLLAAVDALFGSVAFTPPEDATKPWDALHEDIKACRRRATYSLIAIARRLSGHLLPHFQELINRVLTLNGAPNKLAEPEKILLFEFLVIVSRALTDPTAQNEFVLKILQDPVTQWSSEAMGKYFTNMDQFLQLLGMNDEEQKGFTPTSGARTVRIAMGHILNTMVSVFKSVFTAKEGNNISPSAPLLSAVLPNTLRFINAVHTLWSPKAGEVLRHMRPILATTKPHLQAIIGDDKVIPPLILDVQAWLQQAIEYSHSILMVATKAGPTFYQTSPGLFIESVLSHCSYLPTRHIRSLLDKFIYPVAKYCPSDNYGTFLTPIMRGTIVTLFSRLTQSWDKITSTGSGDSDEKLEIMEDTEVRELTRTYLHMFNKLITQPTVADPKPKKAPKKKKSAAAKKEGKTNGNGAATSSGGGIWGEPTWGDAKWGAPADKVAAKKEPPPIPLFCRYLLSDEALWRPLFAMIAGAVSWPDSLSMARAVKCSLLFLPYTLSIPRFHQVWGEVLSGCIRTLAGSRPELLDGIHLDIISLVKEIYSALGRVSDVPRKVFATIPNMDPVELKNLEELLQTEMSDRKYRQAFKAFMTKYVIGINLLSSIDPRSMIRNLPEALVTKSKKVAANAWSEETLGIVSLFAD